MTRMRLYAVCNVVLCAVLVGIFVVAREYWAALMAALAGNAWLMTAIVTGGGDR